MGCETGVLYCGDNLPILREYVPNESVDLVYLDPPFFSNRQYEVIWGDEAEVRSFEDRWEGGINHYVGWMRERTIEMRRILKPNGSFYLHCDWHASHYLKVMVDDIFGLANFRNEIVWKRTSSHPDAKRWGPINDTILYYGKSNRVTWNPQYGPHSEEYVADKYRYREPDGRRYMLDNLRSPNPRPNLTYDYKGYKPHPNGWAVSRERMEQLDAEGRLYFPEKPGGRIRLKRYLDESPGMPLSTMWTDIPPINSQAVERLGYPTQKPLPLLERVIGASSNSGDIVLDPFCGCGTTMAVAERLGRRWIGIDINPTALDLAKRRLGEELGH